ncbi:MAG: acetyl-CoA carboxylase, carboxyltransferase subunit beta [Bacteroidota bacterium]
MSWFKRIKEGITTREKKETPEGLWYKCPSCKAILTTKEHSDNLFVCVKCNFHERIGSAEYFEILIDNNKFTEMNVDMTSADPLNFVDTKKYADRIVDTQKNTGLRDAIRTVYGKINGHKIVIACMDFKYIGGSMGSVMGEKISRAIDHSIEKKCPFLLISKSGGARMMEAALSLMQMAKTAAKLTLLSEAKIPFISLMTDPTTGGVTASFAMLGDLNIAEPGALIGFAGPRVVKETIGKDLPKDFQTSEFVLDHGFLDFIVNRKDLKNKIGQVLEFFEN